MINKLLAWSPASPGIPLVKFFTLSYKPSQDKLVFPSHPVREIHEIHQILHTSEADRYLEKMGIFHSVLLGV